MRSNIPTAKPGNKTRPQQKAAAAARCSLLRYVLDNPNATVRRASEELGMSFSNACRLVMEFKECGYFKSHKVEQPSRAGRPSQVITMQSDLGCSVGVDLEATRIRGVILDFANTVISDTRRPIAQMSTSEEITASVTQTASELCETARQRNLRIYGVGLALPGPLVDPKAGRTVTEFQCGNIFLELLPSVQQATGVHTVAALNVHCFAVGHHRLHDFKRSGIDVVVLNRFGLGTALLWNGQLYTGTSGFAGELGLLPCNVSSTVTRFHDVCTGAGLLRLARLRGDKRSFEEIIASPDDSRVQEWLQEAIPVFARALLISIIVQNPDRVLIEGILNAFPKEVHTQVRSIVADQLPLIAHMCPEIVFCEGEELMGATGAALLARDQVVSEALIEIVRARR